MPTPIKAITAGLLVLTLLFTSLQAANRIVLKAQASEEFTKARALDDSKKIQTYQFMKGKYHGGTTRDDGMKDIPFEGILHDLAINLQKQNFYLHKDRSQGDLLIVVHYGVTDKSRVEMGDIEVIGQETGETNPNN